MKKLTITKELKTFNELSKNLQEKAIEKNREIFYEDVDFYLNDLLTNEIVPMLNDKGFLCSEKNIEYDVNYTQGRGACFTCDNFEFNLLLENLNIPHKKWFIDILDNYVDLRLKKSSYHYCHENTVYVDFFFHDTNGQNRIEKILQQIKDYIENIRYDLCKKICDILTDNYEYYVSDDFIKNEFIENNVYFDSNFKPYWNESEENTQIEYSFNE